MENSWAIAAVWLGLALFASFVAIRFRQRVALVEILVGIAAGNLLVLLNDRGIISWQLKTNDWIAFLAGFGSILLTFMAGTEVRPDVLRRYFKESLIIGVASFATPFVGAMLYARFVADWDWKAAMICGITLSETSVAVVYSVMIETGLNEKDLGKVILAACFLTDLGTVIALGACFANYDASLLVFVAATALGLWLAPPLVRFLLERHGSHISEPGVKTVFFLLFGLGALASLSQNAAVLPAYLVGLVLAGTLAQQRETARRLRTTIFALLTPFYFLNAGMKVHLADLRAGLALIAVLLCLKLVAKVSSVWPLTALLRVGTRERAYSTLLMSTGLTFGTISALYGLSNGYINEKQYSVLVTVVIGSAVVPAVLAQRFFEPGRVPAGTVSPAMEPSQTVDAAKDGSVLPEGVQA
jgi:Kef-type K+ transport system membrane component KefB